MRRSQDSVWKRRFEEGILDRDFLFLLDQEKSRKTESVCSLQFVTTDSLG
jgi:hypothetical protein